MDSMDMDVGDEPSMEDILSSIRKVIAEDKNNELRASDKPSSEPVIEIVPTENLAPAEQLTPIEDMTPVDDIAPLDDDANIGDDAGLDDMAALVSQGEAISGADLVGLLGTPDTLDLEIIVEEDFDDTPINTDHTIDENVLDLQGSNALEPALEMDLLGSGDTGADDLSSALDGLLGHDASLDIEHLDAEDLSLESILGGDIELDTPDVELSSDPEIDLEADLTDFDEGLDLVMDANAADYMGDATDTPGDPSAKIAPEANWRDKATLGAALGGALFAARGDDSSENDSPEDVPGDVTAEQPDTETDELPDFMEGLESETLEALTDTGADADMDLVKSLLADLMDGDGSEISADEQQEAAQDPADILDEILGMDDDAEITITEDPDLEELLPEVNDETADEVADLNVQNEDVADNTLQQIAEQAERSVDVGDAVESADDIVDDVIELPKRNADFALLAGLTAAAGATIAASGSEDAPEENAVEALIESVSDDAPVEEVPNEELEVVAEDIETSAEEEPQEPEQSQETGEFANTDEEEKSMVRIVKKDTLLGDETETDTTSAFASLTEAVEEKAQLEENGPPIGDMVQQALKPMLQEWLDKNLKGIVTRAVAKEIKRISSTK